MSIQRYDLWKNGDDCHMKDDACGKYIRYADHEAEVSALGRDLEIERMRLAACGVVALADTETSRVKAREMNPEYRSASLGDVERRVDECIELRKKLAVAVEALDKLANITWLGSGDRRYIQRPATEIDLRSVNQIAQEALEKIERAG